MIRYTTLIAGMCTLALVSASHGALTFHDDVTPDILFGSGTANGSFTVDRQGSVELGLRTKQRFPTSANVFNDNLDGTYTWEAGLGAAPNHPRWVFEWSVNTDFDGASGATLSDFSYLLELDYDPGPGTDFLAWDHISDPTEPIPFATPINPTFYDHSIGTNGSPNGGGMEAASASAYGAFVAANNVAQNSWRLSTFTLPPYTFDPNAIGRYDIRLTAFDGATIAAQVTIQVEVVTSVTCTIDAQCDDGLACNGVETCNPGTNSCDFGSAVVCGGTCRTGTCLEPSGTCEVAVDGTTCTATPDACSIDDTCQLGLCVDGGGGDPEADGVCGTDDNCPNDANPGQGDLDEDGEGDVCDVNDAVLNPTKVQIRRATNGVNGKTSVKGDFVVVAPDVFTIGSDLTITIEDNLGLDQQQTWTAAQCITRSSGRVTCRDTVMQSRADFHSLQNGQTWRFKIGLRNQIADPPFQGPVTVTLTQNGPALDRTGMVVNCRATRAGLLCRTF